MPILDFQNWSGFQGGVTYTYAYSNNTANNTTIGDYIMPGDIEIHFTREWSRTRMLLSNKEDFEYSIGLLGYNPANPSHHYTSDKDELVELWDRAGSIRAARIHYPKEQQIIYYVKWDIKKSKPKIKPKEVEINQEVNASFRDLVTSYLNTPVSSGSIAASETIADMTAISRVRMPWDASHANYLIMTDVVGFRVRYSLTNGSVDPLYHHLVMTENLASIGVNASTRDIVEATHIDGTERYYHLNFSHQLYTQIDRERYHDLLRSRANR